MKHYKYSAILLAAMTCGAVWASVDALTDGKKGEGEKVKPSENFVAQSRKAPVFRYTKMKVEGNAEGGAGEVELDGEVWKRSTQG